MVVLIHNIGELYYQVSQDSVILKQNELGSIFSLNKEVNLNRAIDNLAKAVEMYTEQGDLDYRSEALLFLANACKQKGDYINIDKYLREHMALKDSVFNQQKAKDIGILTSEREQVEAERKAKAKAEALEKAAQIMRRNNLQYFGLGALIIFIAIMTLLQGKFKFREWLARAMVFITFILTFEFPLVMIDPITDDYSKGEPVIKFAINLFVALIIFPLHQYFERRVTKTLISRGYGSSIEKVLKDFKKT